MSEPELTAEALAEQIRRLQVSDLLLSTCSTLAQVAYAKLDAESRDLEQAQLAVDALRALGPLLERGAGEQLARDFRQVVANLQLAYAQAATAASEPPAGGPSEGGAEPEAPS